MPSQRFKGGFKGFGGFGGFKGCKRQAWTPIRSAHKKPLMCGLGGRVAKSAF